jgi:hypothetical protein
MSRMPQRPTVPNDADRATADPTWPHEEIATKLYEAWRRGSLEAGTELTVKAVSQAHTVSVGTAHRAIERAPVAPTPDLW